MQQRSAAAASERSRDALTKDAAARRLSMPVYARLQADMFCEVDAHAAARLFIHLSAAITIRRHDVGD
jgi:hypothetical protein